MITNFALVKGACTCTTVSSHSQRHVARQTRRPWTRCINDDTERDIAPCAMKDGLLTIANQLSMASTAEWYSRHWRTVDLAVAAPQYCWRTVMATVRRHVKSKLLSPLGWRRRAYMRIAIEVARVSKSQKQRSRTRTQRPGSMLTCGEWRLSCRLCFLIIPSSGHPTQHYSALAFAQRPSNPHSEYLEVVASHRCRCCKKTDLPLALLCKPLRSESVPIHYPSLPVVLRDRFPTSECGELKVTQRIPTPKSTSFETHEYVPETEQHLIPRGVLAVRDKWWSRSCTTRLHGGVMWNGLNGSDPTPP